MSACVTTSNLTDLPILKRVWVNNKPVALPLYMIRIVIIRRTKDKAAECYDVLMSQVRDQADETSPSYNGIRVIPELGKQHKQITGVPINKSKFLLCPFCLNIL